METIQQVIMPKITFAPLFIIDKSIVKKNPINSLSCWDFFYHFVLHKL